MKKTIIPLGGGCNGAIILQDCGVRKQSYPFDWLWNLDAGLVDVKDIILTRFAHVRNRDDYVYARHVQWPDKESLVFRHYPRIAHIHTNPLENDGDLATYQRRIDKFLHLMRDARPVVFLYYRHFSIGGETTNDKTIMKRMEHWVAESEDFMASLRKNYPEKEMSLISLFEGSLGFLDHPPFKELHNELMNKTSAPGIHFEIVLERHDEDEELRKRWDENWRSILRKHGLVGTWDLLLFRPRKIRKKLARHYRRYLMKMRFSKEPDQ